MGIDRKGGQGRTGKDRGRGVYLRVSSGNIFHSQLLAIDILANVGISKNELLI